jgi:hypothetical protein
MTPFELYLEGELNIEWQRFANEWLFKWHGMTYEGGVTDVDDFDSLQRDQVRASAATDILAIH